jgi:S-formylglutathione hydrolase FrmB
MNPRLSGSIAILTALVLALGGISGPARAGVVRAGVDRVGVDRAGLPRAGVSVAGAGPEFGDADGIHVVAVRRIDDRQYNVLLVPAALGRAVNVRILLPAGYALDPAARYPVLYLFHGTGGRAADWVTSGGAEAATARLRLITVMPDGGLGGDGGSWYTNWVDTHTALGPSQWETFHVGELIPWVDRSLRTVARRSGRAIAGLSQGGFGAMSYASRHPDLFVAAASFSGAPDIDHDPVVAIGATAVIDTIALLYDGVGPDAMFGSRVTDEINWQGHDPADLATNLRGMRLSLYTATGIPGPLDPPNPGLPVIGIEALTHISTLGFHQRLEDLGIPSDFNDYVFGTHTFPYWARDLRWYLPTLMAAFEHPAPAPPVVSYAATDRDWAQWGWSVSIKRPSALRFSRLTGAGPDGFTLRGGGTATVTTPAYYRPGGTARVTLTGAAGSRTERVIAGPAGRLVLTLSIAQPVTVAISAPRRAG